jgi:Uma2 family endonuclease
MAVATEIVTAQDLLDSLGGIPASRVLLNPAPGTATEADAIRVNESRRCICELIDGVLVDKGSGLIDSILSVMMISLLHRFVASRNLGVVTAGNLMLRLFPGMIRMPDGAYTSWDHFPGGILPSDPAPAIAPDLVVEVLGASNTKAEMDRKVRDYIEAGTILVWLVDPKNRTITIHDRDAPEPSVYSGSDETVLKKVLPGFPIPLVELSKELDELGRRGLFP